MPAGSRSRWRADAVHVAIALGVIVGVPSVLFAVEPEAALALLWLPAVLAVLVGVSFGVRLGSVAGD